MSGEPHMLFLMTGYFKGSPWFLLGLYLLDGALHPGHQVSHQGEEAELLRRVLQLRPAAVAGVQQAPPRLHHLALLLLDGVRSAPCVLGVEPGGGLLELLDLVGGEPRREPRGRSGEL